MNKKRKKKQAVTRHSTSHLLLLESMCILGQLIFSHINSGWCYLIYIKHHLGVLKIQNIQTKCILEFFFGTSVFNATLSPVFHNPKWVCDPLVNFVHSSMTPRNRTEKPQDKINLSFSQSYLSSSRVYIYSNFWKILRA